MQSKQTTKLTKTSALVNGAAILGLAAVISKLLGTLQKIPLQNIGGDEVFGIYTAVFPFYTLILFLATAGFPITVSKFVSEYEAQGNEAGARRVLHISSVILCITGILFFLLLFFGANSISRLIDNTQTALAIQSVSFALIFVPVMAALRGFFQGRQNMIPTGISQVIEQLVRVAVMVSLLLYFTSIDLSQEWIAAGATFGSAAGAVAGLIVMLIFWFKDRAKRVLQTVWEDRDSIWQLSKRLVLYALPVCLGAIVVPILSIVDTFTMPRLLKLGGLSESEAMINFGIYARGFPLVQLVAMIFSALAVALVPSISGAKLQGKHTVIHNRAELSIRFTWLVGWAASVGLAVTAAPINVMFYMNDAGTMAMMILAFTAIFSALNIVTAALLQGLGAVLIPAFSLLVAAVVKVSLNLIWVPIWGIEGAAAAAVLTYVVASMLNVIMLSRMIRLRFSMTSYIGKPMLSLLLMTVGIYGWMYGWQWLVKMLQLSSDGRWFNVWLALSSVVLGAGLFVMALFWTRAIGLRELKHVPSIGHKLTPLLYKFKLISKDEGRD